MGAPDRETVRVGSQQSTTISELDDWVDSDADYHDTVKQYRGNWQSQ